jgi:hypothetical protein
MFTTDLLTLQPMSWVPMSDLPEPEMLGCFFDEGFSPSLPVMRLRWLSTSFRRRRIWRLPAGLRITGPAPQRFGITIHRVSTNEYDVCLVWDATRLCLSAVARSSLTASSLPLFLRAMGTDLDYLLDQPVLPNRQTLVRDAA